MSNHLIGTIQTMEITNKTGQDCTLTNPLGRVLCPLEDEFADIPPRKPINVFIYPAKEGGLRATTHLPTAELSVFGWGKVVKVLPKLGAFVDIGTVIDILVSIDDFPLIQHAWPTVGDSLYVRLKKDKQDRLLAIPANENEFAGLIAPATDVELNHYITGTVIRPGREGAVILSEDGYRGFIHHTEREKEVRLGELVTGRVIEVKEDGSLNLSLLPLKHERMAEDADKIFAYLEANDGVMPFGNKTDPDIIGDTFSMSKSAFKRALGRLIKEGKVEQRDGKTFLL